MKTKKEFLYNDTDSYNYNLKLESNIFEIFDRIKQQATETLGADFDVDYKKLIADPVDYLVSNYWSMAGRKKHLYPRAKEICVSDTGLNIPQLNKDIIAFNRFLPTLGSNAPTVKKDGLYTTITKKQFDRFLNPEKADHYHALKKFYDSGIELKEFGYFHSSHLMRIAPGFWLEKMEAVINHSQFQE